KGVVPGAVEDEAGNQQQPQVLAPFNKDKVEQHKENGKEPEKEWRIKQHVIVLLVMPSWHWPGHPDATRRKTRRHTAEAPANLAAAGQKRQSVTALISARSFGSGSLGHRPVQRQVNRQRQCQHSHGGVDQDTGIDAIAGRDFIRRQGATYLDELRRGDDRGITTEQYERHADPERSEERRVGKEWRSRRSP